MTNLFSLKTKNAWVTGACYGIGFAIAKAFAQAGAEHIIFNARSQEAIDKALEDYHAAGIHNAHGYVCDVTDEVAVKELVERIHREVGPIHILVNNAGIIKRIPMHEMKREEFQQVIDIDLVAPYIVSAAVLPEMMERREDKIINICSMMSELGRETVSAYAAAKGGLKMLTRNICSASTASIISSATVLVRVISLRRRRHRCANRSRTEVVILSMPSSAPRRLPDVGSNPMSWVHRPFSSLPMHPMPLTDRFCTSMAVSSLISDANRSEPLISNL